MIILDTSGPLAAFVADQRHHAACSDALSADPIRIVSPFVLAELDAELAILAELSSGAYELAAFGAEDVAQAAEVIDRYRDQRIGLADASLVALAHRYQTRRILTLDQRHFRALSGLDGHPFELVPLD